MSAIIARESVIGRLNGWLARSWRSDFAHDFRRSPIAIASMAIILLYVAAASFPSFFAPRPVFDLATLDFADAFKPPAWLAGGDWRFLFGADDQGRDVLSAIIYGLRVSLFVSVAAVALSVTIGVTLGLVAGFFGGLLDSVIMRIADLQLTFPAMLVAVLVDGLLRASVGQRFHEEFAVLIIIVAIALSGWVQYARTVRGLTMVVATHNYVLAARMLGRSVPFILFRHILPNVATPVFVVATIQLAVAIILEATLSFVGLGIPPTQPSLGTLIRVGNGYLLSGEWWLAIFPGLALLVLVLAVNLLGDFLRDALNPRLK
ncbi:MAG: ABC transporter permease [Methylobacterium sp.]|nr:ABC transporter permease [Methylobacterium sp.]MCA3602343.1 ABC transporter permease [Methylobacterium sp.]MCA3613939.1 ABC transporter permease [Methylobacterium sp.]MCA3642294.1 ABC transporter permease [Methylobacterium sp.]